MRNDYSAVNNVMGRSSDWRDNSSHDGKAATRLSWEYTTANAEAALEQHKAALLKVPGVVKVWVARTQPSYGLRKLSVKYVPELATA